MIAIIESFTDDELTEFGVVKKPLGHYELRRHGKSYSIIDAETEILVDLLEFAFPDSQSDEGYPHESCQKEYLKFNLLKALCEAAAAEDERLKPTFSAGDGVLYVGLRVLCVEGREGFSSLIETSAKLLDFERSELFLSILALAAANLEEAMKNQSKSLIFAFTGKEMPDSTATGDNRVPMTWDPSKAKRP